MIALDLDGTLLDYAPEGPEPRVNHAVIAALQARGVTEVAICTNQGGLPFGVLGKLRKDGRPYPTPFQFAVRLIEAIKVLVGVGIAVKAVHVSLWHDYAEAQAIREAQRAIEVHRYGVPVVVYTTPAARKPSPLMLRAVGASEYWGDSPEDAEAARNAGVPFVHVERFL